MRRGKDVSDEDKVGLGFVVVSGRDEKGAERERKKMEKPKVFWDETVRKSGDPLIAFQSDL